VQNRTQYTIKQFHGLGQHQKQVFNRISYFTQKRKSSA